MREVFAHEAELIMAPDGDIQAPGAAVTVGVCGHWDHEPPCPLAPHNTQAHRVGGVAHLRTVFAAGPDSEDAVRQRIDDALTGGELLGPRGLATHWQLSDSRHSAVSAAEEDLAERLIRT
ncbi:MAG: hypothetical protein ABJA81_12455 [Nocardioidaceae bacterium]